MVLFNTVCDYHLCCILSNKIVGYAYCAEKNEVKKGDVTRGESMWIQIRKWG